jgi:cytochrome c-type biogenesis protein
MVEILLAFAAGMATIASPCVLPMLPIIVGAAIGQTSRARPLFVALGFVLAFSSVALIFGAFADALGAGNSALRSLAAVLLMAFGALMVWPHPFERLAGRLGAVVERLGASGGRAAPGNLGGFFLGMSLGVLWTPCAGPVLGSILTLVATAATLGRAALLLSCYAIGAGVPMLAIAYGGHYATTRVRRLAPYTLRLRQGFGVLVMLIAFAMYFQYDTRITLWLATLYPTGSGL